MAHAIQASSTAWWKQSKYVVPLILLVVSSYTLLSRYYFVDEVTSRNFSIQCQPEAMDGKSELSVTIDGTRYAATKRYDNCEAVRQKDATEIRIVVRKNTSAIRGLYLDGQAIQSTQASAIGASLGLFLVVWLSWLAMIALMNKFNKNGSGEHA